MFEKKREHINKYIYKTPETTLLARVGMFADKAVLWINRTALGVEKVLGCI